MTAVGVLIRWQKEGIGGLCAYVGAVLLMGAFLYPFFRIGALGAGDVKLFGVTAGYLPFEKIFYFSFSIFPSNIIENTTLTLIAPFFVKLSQFY